MDSFQERKQKNFQVESDPFFGHLWNQTLIGLTKPGRHFGLGASRHMKKHLSKEYILIPEENKRNVLPYKDALVNLAETNVLYKTKKRILVHEGVGFIQDLLVPAVTSVRFLML